jgi:hypothetical protein
VDGGRLAGAVGAEEAVDLTGLDSQVDAGDRSRTVLELAFEALDLDAVVWLHGGILRRWGMPDVSIAMYSKI